ncbi:hypothetical protein MNBD_BACTEROID01-509 [hydrothermal vent metagenome]|uniref:FlgD/Vpr Ig-like domain-containing protein n=1 Tax=hydrothermal vent metagenome TaxID=652676 RepID=A0A3B0UB78_9ZZZZ
MKKQLKFRNLFGTFLFLFLAGSLSAQSTFYKKYDYAGDDFGNFVIETSDGGYAIIGTTNSLGAGNYDIWLLKTDSSGDTLWTKTYGGPDNDEGYCLRETNDNGFIIAGYKTVPGHYRDGWIIKTDATGNIDWDYTFGTELNGESATSLVKAENNSFIVSGNVNSKSYVFKIDDEGNVLWEQTYFTTQSSSANSICQTNDGFAVAGSFQVYSAGGWYPNIFTIDSVGNLGYQLTYMNQGQGWFQFIIGTTDNGIVFGGEENGENVVYKLSAATGLEEWNYNYESVINTWTKSATETPDNNIVITDNSWDASLRKLNTTTGDTLWTRTSEFFPDYPKYTELTTTSDNGLIITGYTSNHGVVLVKTMQNGSMTGIESQNNIQKSISLNQNFPNPFSEQTELSFQLSNHESIELYITDINNKRIRTLFNNLLAPGEYKYTWDGNNAFGSTCPSGIYYAILKTKNGIAETRKMIKILNKPSL